MHKRLLAVFVSVTFSSATYAQGRLGVKAGVSYAQYMGETKASLESVFVTELEPVLGFHGGVSWALPNRQQHRFAWHTDFLYSQRGYRHQVTRTQAGYIRRIVDHYVDGLLLGRYAVTKALYLEAGPQLGLLLAITSRTKGPNDYNDFWVRHGLNISYGFAAGLGYAVTPRVQLGLRYNVSALGRYGNGNTVAQLSAGYTLGRKRAE